MNKKAVVATGLSLVVLFGMGAKMMFASPLSAKDSALDNFAKGVKQTAQNVSEGLLGQKKVVSASASEKPTMSVDSASRTRTIEFGAIKPARADELEVVGVNVPDFLSFAPAQANTPDEMQIITYGDLSSRDNVMCVYYSIAREFDPQQDKVQAAFVEKRQAIGAKFEKQPAILFSEILNAYDARNEELKKLIKGPSFDPKTATSEAQKIIAGNADLSRHDVYVAVLHRIALRCAKTDAERQTLVKQEENYRKNLYALPSGAAINIYTQDRYENLLKFIKTHQVQDVSKQVPVVKVDNQIKPFGKGNHVVARKEYRNLSCGLA